MNKWNKRKTLEWLFWCLGAAFFGTGVGIFARMVSMTDKTPHGVIVNVSLILSVIFIILSNHFHKKQKNDNQDD